MGLTSIVPPFPESLSSLRFGHEVQRVPIREFDITKITQSAYVSCIF